MTDRRSIDLVLLFALLPVWVTFAVLHLGLSIDGRIAWVPLYVESASQGATLPSISGFWSRSDEDRLPLRIGDRIVRIGDREMTGASQADVVLALYDQRQGGRAVGVEIDRGGVRQGVVFQFEPIPNRWRTSVIALGMGAIGFLSLWRGRGRRETRALALATLAYSFHWLLLIGGPPWMTRLGFALFFGSGALFEPLALAVPMVFPADRAIRSGAARSARWAFAAIGPLMASMMLGVPLAGPLGARLLLFVNAAFAIAFLALVARSWIGASAISRRQIKWVLLGCYLGLVPVLGAALFASATGERWWIYEASLVATIAIPVALLIAMLRYDFMDVDRLITASATYTILVALVGAPLPGVVPRISVAAAEATTLPADYFQTAFFFALLLVAWRAEAFLRPWIDRVVFREARAHEAGLEKLKEQLDACATPSNLLLAFGRGVCEVMSVDRAVLLVESGGRFAPVFEHGRSRGLPLPTIAADGALARWVGGVTGARAIGSRRRFEKLVRPDAAERAVVLDIDAAAIAPCRRGISLEALLVLGFKRSGDVLTPTELARIDAVAERVAFLRSRFERDQLEREERELVARMLSYAPDRLLTRMREGRDDEAGEREVTVLFVDIRGMSALAEQSAGDHLFRLIEGFTRRAAEIIRAQGGMIVEFQGDCLMAIYGAPDPHPSKEEAAVASGLTLIRELGGPEFRRMIGRPLDVRVGIATGIDFVGTIDCVERRAWTSVGNTSNLAARLEGEVSKTLGLPLVVDEATWLAAGRPEDLTRYEGVAVRGRSSVVTVYAGDPRRGRLALAS